MPAEALLDQLRAYVGTEGPVQVARHPVNAPAIADWCDAIGDDNRSVSHTSTFSTIRPRTLTYPSINPLDGETVGVGMPLAIYFDEPIADRQAAENAITVTTTPPVYGTFYWFSKK